MPRGSLKHVLDLLDSGRFAVVMSNILGEHGVHVVEGDTQRPQGYADSEEWTVRRFCAEHCKDRFDFARFDAWWVPDRYRNPQWDILSTCTIDGTPGLLLVEAKANDQELDWNGKPLSPKASDQSKENHHIIGQCIEEANSALNQILPGFSISRDTHYQLSNRIATAWKLADCGLPVALLYLGFTGDAGMRTPTRQPLIDRDHWLRLMGAYLHGVMPQHFPCTTIHFGGNGNMRMLIESLSVIETSPRLARCPQNEH
ncbi:MULTISPECIES: hypothetical protein [unclassified Pseudodesulfovibrio]|uniref:hypothetical protein n=1 Tax=unclassified Pseudodesulfovibrio TaxID=2661612 RepID=UPI000FEBC7D0|nr:MULTISPECIES: hypothetical protein [unclassified Pseudodesulfovibrio]MCJ2165598.1 hypothetical protein [Pseudodesulfovibrio sp. S3-i]RWU03006.1 hypothetical protein DWB63_13225 [Pseudodesulfovibrio sp. S3]